MMNTADALSQQINNARASAAHVAKQDKLRAEAESLPGLEQKAKAIQQREAARFNLNATVQDVKAALDVCKAGATDERKRLDFAIAELHALQASIPETAKRIIAAGRKLQAAVNSAEMCERALGGSLGRDSFYKAWENCGGFDKALNSTVGFEAEAEYLANYWGGLRHPVGYKPGLDSFT